jgi:hypothetical protein
MSRLAAQQQALLDALFAWSSDDAMNNIATHARFTCARGLKAYQANGHAAAERSLQAAYPVLQQLLGQESLSALARAFWHATPPVRGDLAQWGGGLAEFIKTSDQLAEEPYLPDVARVEWALHRCASAPDQAADPASFALLMQHDPADLQLLLVPGCTVVQSAWPVASIMGAHLEQAPSFAEVGQRLRAGTPEVALVWRAGLRPSVREAWVGEAAWIHALGGGNSLAAALDAAPALDFNAWLSMAVQTGLLLGAKTHAPHHSN